MIYRILCCAAFILLIARFDYAFCENVLCENNKLPHADNSPLAALSADILSADTDKITMTSGGVIHFLLNAGSSNQNRNYYLLGSQSGTQPGTLLPGGIVTLPLNWDWFTNLTITLSNSPYLENFHGTMDGTGAASATLNTYGPLPSITVGMKLHFAFLLYGPYDFVSNAVEIDIIHTEGWHYLASFPNYAPSGLPDFDQKQDTNWQSPFLPGENFSYCGPVAASNILWWFDSKHSDPAGYPGDGNDDYTLVQRYYPAADDHSEDNVHPLIELVAYYTKTDTIPPGGTTVENMIDGLTDWLVYTGLDNQYSIVLIEKPTFSQIQEIVQSDCGVLLQLFGFMLEFPYVGFWRHWIAVAGVSDDGWIAVSDPYRDIKKPDSSGPNYTWHNDPSIVSHDTWYLDEGYLGYFYLKGYWWNGRILYAVVLSEK